MERYFTEKLTHDELDAKIMEAWKEHNDYEINKKDYGRDDAVVIQSLTDTIEKDLEAVDFNCENVDLEGFKTLDNGLTYVGVHAGGDWEVMLYFAIYWDGSELRAYIPEDGNPWNTDVNYAYGNHNSDVYNAIDRGFFKDTEGKTGDDLQCLFEEKYIEPDFDKIHAEMQKNIKFKEK
ncbi:MAG: hypothetical protein KKA79_01840 [Nanoarchaeota archaeon]|nr:hypothetical protein [Nanoarchaeota archaeon]MCG2719033.1 hypothetical protein [Nanoarchaeota archaeon]